MKQIKIDFVIGAVTIAIDLNSFALSILIGSMHWRMGGCCKQREIGICRQWDRKLSAAVVRIGFFGELQSIMSDGTRGNNSIATVVGEELRLITANNQMWFFNRYFPFRKLSFRFLKIVSNPKLAPFTRCFFFLILYWLPEHKCNRSIQEVCFDYSVWESQPEVSVSIIDYLYSSGSKELAGTILGLFPVN